MSRYICTVCGYVYEESKGIPDAGIAPGTKWEKLPDGWVCPLCGAAKSEFRKDGEEQQEMKQQGEKQQGERQQGENRPEEKQRENGEHGPEELKELTALEMSALCSNLAKGCEKQYRAGDAANFTILADYFKRAAAPAEQAADNRLLSLVEQDLAERFPAANGAAKEAGDRGALRALTWSEKVTRILKSLLTRYETEGEAMVESTGVYVCTICGFIYIGDTPPELCPVCKVPSWKFEKIEGRA